MRHLVGNLEDCMSGIYGEPDAGHLLKHMQKIGGIRIMLHRILTPRMNLVPNVSADGK